MFKCRLRILNYWLHRVKSSVLMFKIDINRWNLAHFQITSAVTMIVQEMLNCNVMSSVGL